MYRSHAFMGVVNEINKGESDFWKSERNHKWHVSDLRWFTTGTSIESVALNFANRWQSERVSETKERQETGWTIKKESRSR